MRVVLIGKDLAVSLITTAAAFGARNAINSRSSTKRFLTASLQRT
jgi:hypothetical protein